MSRIRSFAPVLFLLSFLLMLPLIAGCSLAPIGRLAPNLNSIGGGGEEDYPDKLYTDGPERAELVIAVMGDKLVDVSRGNVLDEVNWGSGVVRRELGGVEDGKFYELEVEVTYLNGGIAGYSNEPVIEKVNGYSEISPDSLDIPTASQRTYKKNMFRLEGDDSDKIATVGRGVYGLWDDGRWYQDYDDSTLLSDGKTRAVHRASVTPSQIEAGVRADVTACEEYFVYVD